MLRDHRHRDWLALLFDAGARAFVTAVAMDASLGGMFVGRTRKGIMRTVLGTLLTVLGVAGLLAACGGGSKSEPESEAAAAAALFGEVVEAKLATALGLGGPESIVWEKENTSAWKDAQLFANRILGEVEVPALDEMEITVLDDETSGDGGTVVVRVQVADLTADYRISMQEIDGQWRVHDYQVEEVVEAMGR